MHGQLTARSATDVCRELAEAGATGVLFITGLRASGRVVLDRGRLVAANSPTPGSRLGDRLVNGGLLDEADLDRLLEEQHETPQEDRTRLGKLLVDRGLVPFDAVRSVIEEQLLDAVFDLSGWRDGSYRFEPDAALEAPEVPIELPVDQALMEVARRRVEWEALSEVITDLDAVPHFRDGANTESAALEPDEFSVLASVDGSRSVRDLAYDLGYGEFEAARIVYALHLVGLVDVAPPVDEIGAALDEALSFVVDAEGGQAPPGGTPQPPPRQWPTDAAPTSEPSADVREEHRAPSSDEGDDAPTPTAGRPGDSGKHDGRAPVAAPSEDAEVAFDTSIFDQAWAEPEKPEAWHEADVPAGPPASEAEAAPEEPGASNETDVPAGSPVDEVDEGEASPSDPGRRSEEDDTTLEADLPDLSGFDELRLADHHLPEEPPVPSVPDDPAPAEAPLPATGRSPSPGAGADVSEFLRELSRLALDEEAPDPAQEKETPRPSRDAERPRPTPAEPRDEPRKKKRGLFGFGG
jgi:hypothetical protein